MAFFAVPRLRKILGIRQLRIDTLLNVANRFNEKSEKIKKEAEDLLAKTKQDILKTEEELISELERKNTEEKKKLSEEILENTNREMASLKISSEEVFKSVSSDLDELLNLALQKMGNQKP